MLHDERVPEIDRERLNRYMEQRRAELGRRWEDVARIAGLPRETINQVRFGQSNMRALTKRRVEQGLDWTAGSVDSVLDGGEPTPVAGSSPVDAIVARINANPRVPEERKRELIRLVRQAEAQMAAESAAALDELRRWDAG